MLPFSKYDLDSDGYITRNELHDIVEFIYKIVVSMTLTSLDGYITRGELHDIVESIYKMVVRSH